MTTQEVTDRRKKLIEALRSGEFKKGEHALIVPTLSPTHEVMYNAFCCIGVGICILPGMRPSFTSFINESGKIFDGYQEFMIQYEVTEELSNQLAAMNDGSTRSVSTDDEDGWEMRRQGPERSHPFIARYLEIVWELS